MGGEENETSYTNSIRQAYLLMEQLTGLNVEHKRCIRLSPMIWRMRSSSTSHHHLLILFSSITMLVSSCYYRGHDNEILDIWAFQKRITDTRIQQPKVTTEEYYDHNWRWSKEFSMGWHPHMSCYKPFAITKSSEVLLWHEHNKLQLSLWDGEGTGFAYLQAIPHMNTLVSLKDLGENAAVIM